MTHYKPLLLLLSSLCFTVFADQQTTRDEGVNHGKALIGGVRNLSTTTDPTTTPGYQNPTTLPAYQYYGSQNVTGMQTDATVNLSTGAANDASSFAWGQSTVPKLLFNPATDPILTNAETIGLNAINNPGQITTTTGDCAIAQVSNTEPRLEHCTAWMIPTQHNCNKTVNVDVTWDNVSNCPLGTTFNQVQATSGYGGADQVYARAVCNPGSGTNAVDLQVHALGGNGSCTGWTDITVSTSQTGYLYTGATLQPHWGGGCTPVPVFAQGSCSGGNCNYALDYVVVRSWTRTAIDRGIFTYSCSGVAMDLGALGYFGWSTLARNGLHCVFKRTSVPISFAKPTLTRVPTVTETIDNQCANLEAQLP